MLDTSTTVEIADASVYEPILNYDSWFTNIASLFQYCAVSNYNRTSYLCKQIMACRDNESSLFQDTVLNTYTTIESSSVENQSKPIMAFRDNDSENDGHPIAQSKNYMLRYLRSMRIVFSG